MCTHFFLDPLLSLSGILCLNLLKSVCITTAVWYSAQCVVEFCLVCWMCSVCKVVHIFNYSPGAAGPRGSPVPPQSEQTSLCCSSLQQLSWQPKFYPGWKNAESRQTQESTNTFIIYRAAHLFTICSSNTVYLISSCVLVGTISQTVFGHFDKLIFISLYETYSIMTAVLNFDFI